MAYVLLGYRINQKGGIDEKTYLLNVLVLFISGEWPATGAY